MADDFRGDPRSEAARVSREAARWVAQIELGRADHAKFARWRDADPRHAVAFARLTASWSLLNGTTPGTSDVLTRAQTPTHSAGRRTALKAAGLGALAMAGAALVTSRAYARDRASTGVGQSRLIRLAGASVMVLNTDSAASWRSGGSETSLWLERGEIAIDLNPAQGSILLRGGDGEARLTAGRFNARLIGGALDLMVLRGTASATEDGTALPVAARHSLLLTGGKPIVRPSSSDEVAATLAWQSGEIVFLDEPLASAVENYNRHLIRKIVIADPQLGSIRVGGRFTSKDPAAFLQSLQTSLAIKVVTSNNSVLLTR